jgi:hypothetical protein
VAFVFVLAGTTFPDIFVGDVVGMFCCYNNVSVGEVVGAFFGPKSSLEYSCSSIWRGC